jgi:hypothetical protein
MLDTDPLTTLQKEAMAKLAEKGRLIVGNRLDVMTGDVMKTRGLRRCDVFTSVARGLQRRGLVKLTRPKTGPMIMEALDDQA